MLSTAEHCICSIIKPEQTKPSWFYFFCYTVLLVELFHTFSRLETWGFKASTKKQKHHVNDAHDSELQWAGNHCDQLWFTVNSRTGSVWFIFKIFDSLKWWDSIDSDWKESDWMQQEHMSKYEYDFLRPNFGITWSPCTTSSEDLKYSALVMWTTFMIHLWCFCVLFEA